MLFSLLYMFLEKFVLRSENKIPILLINLFLPPKCFLEIINRSDKNIYIETFYSKIEINS